MTGKVEKMIARYKSIVLKSLLHTLVSVAFVVPSAAFAQDEGAEEPPTDARRQTLAREQYQRGKGLYEAENYTEALEAFQTAYDTKPHPVVLKSIAECKIMLGAIPEAIELLEKYLSDPRASKKEDVEQRVNELRSMLGSLEVTSEPVGAEIVLDEKETGKVTPYTLELGPGEYEVTLNAEGYAPLVKYVSLESSEQGILSVDFAVEGTPITSPADEMAMDEVKAEEDAMVEEDQDDGNGPPPVFWVCAALTGVGLVSGTIFGVMALSDEKDFSDNQTNAKRDAGEREAIIADVSFGVAGAAAIAGTIILLTHGKNKKEDNAADSKVNIMPIADGNTVGINTVVNF